MLILLSLHFLKQHRLNFELNKTPPTVPAFRLPCNGFYLEEHRENRPPLRFWQMRPDDISFRMPTKTKSGVFCILDFQRMSDVTDQYLLRARQVTEDQYDSLRIALSNTLQRQGWEVKQIRFIAGARSQNEQDLRDNLKLSRVQEVYSKQASY
jgi:hypothetical protein